MSRGLVFIHQAPSTLLAHVEWTLSGICGRPAAITWHSLPAPLQGFRGVSNWNGASESGSVLASAFMNLKQLSFEVIQDSTAQESGYRWSFTPTLGVFSCATDEIGNVLVNENQLLIAVARMDSSYKLSLERC
jgi:hypothetical protein